MLFFVNKFYEHRKKKLSYPNEVRIGKTLRQTEVIKFKGGLSAILLNIILSFFLLITTELIEFSIL